MRRFVQEFWLAAKEGPRLYFAPLIGAIHGVRDEVLGHIEYSHEFRQ